MPSYARFAESGRYTISVLRTNLEKIFIPPICIYFQFILIFNIDLKIECHLARLVNVHCVQVLVYSIYDGTRMFQNIMSTLHSSHLIFQILNVNLDCPLGPVRREHQCFDRIFELESVCYKRFEIDVF